MGRTSGKIFNVGVPRGTLVYDSFLGKPLFTRKTAQRVFFFSLFFSPFVHACESPSDSSLYFSFRVVSLECTSPSPSILRTPFRRSRRSHLFFFLICAKSDGKYPFQFLRCFRQGVLEDESRLCVTSFASLEVGALKSWADGIPPVCF